MHHVGRLIRRKRNKNEKNKEHRILFFLFFCAPFVWYRVSVWRQTKFEFDKSVASTASTAEIVKQTILRLERLWKTKTRYDEKCPHEWVCAFYVSCDIDSILSIHHLLFFLLSNDDCKWKLVEKEWKHAVPVNYMAHIGTVPKWLNAAMARQRQRRRRRRRRDSEHAKCK